MYLYTYACFFRLSLSKLFKNWSQIWPEAESGLSLVRSSLNPENVSLPVVPGHSGCTANPTPPYHFCQPTPSSHLWFNSPGYRQMGVFLKPKKNKQTVKRKKKKLPELLSYVFESWLPVTSTIEVKWILSITMRTHARTTLTRSWSPLEYWILNLGPD